MIYLYIYFLLRAQKRVIGTACKTKNNQWSNNNCKNISDTQQYHPTEHAQFDEVNKHQESTVCYSATFHC